MRAIPIRYPGVGQLAELAGGIWKDGSVRVRWSSCVQTEVVQYFFT